MFFIFSDNIMLPIPLSIYIYIYIPLSIKKSHANQEVFSSQSSSHQLAYPFVFVEFPAGRVGHIVVSGLPSAL